MIRTATDCREALLDGQIRAASASPAIAASARPSPTPWRPRIPLICGLLALLAGAGAVLLSYRRLPPETEWSSVALWAASLVLTTAACWTPLEREAGSTGWARGDLAAILVLTVTACALLLPALAVYPLEVASDPPRDSGFLTQSIVDGRTRQIFKYGYFNGFSFVMPLTGVPFYWVFGPSSLSFKALAATLGIATPVLLYWMVRRHLSRSHALAAGLLLLSLPVYLFYARREPIHAFNPFWMLAVLGALLRVLEHKTAPRTLGLLGMVAGITVHFHPGVKAAAFCALALAAVAAIVRSLARRQSWRRLMGAGVMAVTGFFVGLGPLVLATDLGILLSSGRLSPDRGRGLANLLERWLVSLRVFFDLPTMSWFPTHEPLIPSAMLAGLFALGVLLGFLVVPLRIHLALVFFLLVLPLTNSALTDIVNGDHRLSPLLPVVAWIMAIGIAVIWRAASRVRPAALRGLLRAIAAALVAVGAVPQVYRFFDQEQARHRFDLASHLMHFALREIEVTPELRDAPELCIGGNRWVYDHMLLDHFRDGWGYYLPGRTVRAAELAPDAANNEIFVATSCTQPPAPEAWRERVLCSPRQRYVCPGSENGVADLRVHLDLRPPPPPLPGQPSAVAAGPRDRPTLPNATVVGEGRSSLSGLAKLDVAAWLLSSQASIRVNDPAFASRIAGVLDGRAESVTRSEGINPLVIDLELEAPIRLRGARLLVSASPHDWVLEPAAGRRFLATAASGEWSQLDLPETVETSSVHLELLRLERDNYVHVAEIELYTDP